MALLPSVIPGCLSQCSYHVEKDWRDNSLYPKFPPDGQYGEFTVQRHAPPEAVVNAITVDSRDEHDIHMMVYREGNVGWDALFRDEPSQNEVSALLNHTFVTVKIGAPPHFYGTFEPAHTC
jgi:hypothetical protein